MVIQHLRNNRGSVMKKAVAVPRITRLKAGMPGAVAVWGLVWGWGGVVAVLITLSLVLWGRGLRAISISPSANPTRARE
jgi:fatty acid desaturase